MALAIAMPHGLTASSKHQMYRCHLNPQAVGVVAAKFDRTSSDIFLIVLRSSRPDCPQPAAPARKIDQRSRSRPPMCAGADCKELVVSWRKRWPGMWSAWLRRTEGSEGAAHQLCLEVRLDGSSCTAAQTVAAEINSGRRQGHAQRRCPPPGDSAGPKLRNALPLPRACRYPTGSCQGTWDRKVEFSSVEM